MWMFSQSFLNGCSGSIWKAWCLLHSRFIVNEFFGFCIVSDNIHHLLFFFLLRYWQSNITTAYKAATAIGDWVCETFCNRYVEGFLHVWRWEFSSAWTKEFDGVLVLLHWDKVYSCSRIGRLKLRQTVEMCMLLACINVVCAVALQSTHLIVNRLLNLQAELKCRCSTWLISWSVHEEVWLVKLVV